MGRRSEVGFCFAPGVEVPKFEDIELDWKFDRIVRDERGVFYYVAEIKWYGLDGTPRAVEDFCKGLDSESYLFVRMTEGEVEIGGELWDNEFGLGYISRLDFDDYLD